jgi:hypothetical protein
VYLPSAKKQQPLYLYQLLWWVHLLSAVLENMQFNKRYTCKSFVVVEESVLHTKLQSREAQNECALCTRASSPSKLETKGHERTYTEEMMGYSLAAIDMVHFRVIKSSGTVIMCPQR